MGEGDGGEGGRCEPEEKSNNPAAEGGRAWLACGGGVVGGESKEEEDDGGKEGEEIENRDGTKERGVEQERARRRRGGAREAIPQGVTVAGEGGAGRAGGGRGLENGGGSGGGGVGDEEGGGEAGGEDAGEFFEAGGGGEVGEFAAVGLLLEGEDVETGEEAAVGGGVVAELGAGEEGFGCQDEGEVGGCHGGDDYAVVAVQVSTAQPVVSGGGLTWPESRPLRGVSRRPSPSGERRCVRGCGTTAPRCPTVPPWNAPCRPPPSLDC